MMNNPNGFQPRRRSCLARNRTGSATAQGQLVQFDLANSDGDVTNNTLGSDASGWANFIAPQSGDLDHGVFGIVLNPEAVADNGVCQVMLYGVDKALVFDSGSSSAGIDIAVGSPLEGLASQGALNAVQVAGNRVLALCLEDVTDADPKILASVWFEGGADAGFGVA